MFYRPCSQTVNAKGSVSVGQSVGGRSVGGRSVGGWSVGGRSVGRRSVGRSAVGRSVGRSAVGRSVGQSVGRSVGRSIGQSVRTFSLKPWLWWIPNVDMWVRATGTRHSKSLERCFQRTACLQAVSWISGFPILEQVTNI